MVGEPTNFLARGNAHPSRGLVVRGEGLGGVPVGDGLTRVPYNSNLDWDTNRCPAVCPQPWIFYLAPWTTVEYIKIALSSESRIWNLYHLVGIWRKLRDRSSLSYDPVWGTNLWICLAWSMSHSAVTSRHPRDLTLTCTVSQYAGVQTELLRLVFTTSHCGCLKTILV